MSLAGRMATDVFDVKINDWHGPGLGLYWSLDRCALPCLHGSRHERRAVTHQSERSENCICHQASVTNPTPLRENPQMVSLFCFSLFSPCLRSARASRGVFACQTMPFHSDSATIERSRNRARARLSVWWRRTRQRAPCAWLIQASPRSIRLLIMTV